VKPGEIPDYSDGEEDIGDATHVRGLDAKTAWPPEFIRRNSLRASSPVVQPTSRKLPLPVGVSKDTQGLMVDSSTASASSHSSTLPVDMASVPATPSLIKAVTRIHLAHQTMALPSPIPTSSGISPPLEHERRKSWDAFWNDVKTKAHY